MLPGVKTKFLQGTVYRLLFRNYSHTKHLYSAQNIIIVCASYVFCLVLNIVSRLFVWQS
jgi:hypothetical protein